ncbi:hypothetical protein DFH08DRAFT_776585 [Mycena albidolilacea]|uniref:Uncharacterized protein n=1 Tax=Mycena albidolilacea TaxID=1033008 RepID=A0AAD7A775_9AGAR|nr:hypothetical protein DFH08DRAFT_776585 [Mycena albidolilacea]
MPELPSELEREIFTIAFRSSGQDVALKLTLCLVARRVQFWIEHLFYEVVSISGDRCANGFLSLVNSKPPGFFTVVNCLCITHSVKAVTACSILAACTAVESLACWVDSDGSSELPLLISRLPLHRLSIELEHFAGIPLASSTWLSSLTHIDLIPWGPFPAQGLSTLRDFSRLTHVALYPDVMKGEMEHVVMVCSSCPCLQVLVIPDTDGYIGLVLQPAHDPRMVEQKPALDIIEDREAPYSGCEDMWSRAEIVLDQRKALPVNNE